MTDDHAGREVASARGAGRRLAVTGAGGRLGSAVRRALARSDVAEVIGWDLPEHDLDDATSPERLLQRDGPDLVIHCAAWTDVDGCARNPDLALRRNGTATGDLAAACVRHHASLVVISTNEVFDGARTDGAGYGPADEPNPINAYGASKLAGERAAQAAFGDPAGAPASTVARETVPAAAHRQPQPGLLIVRTAWLFGPGAPDFPTKIIAAARRAAADGGPLRVVADEWGTPTYGVDLAHAIVELALSGATGIAHVVNAGIASRADWARDVLDRCAVRVATADVPATTWERPSRPPRWGVLQPTALPDGTFLRPWRDAMAEYVQHWHEAAADGPRLPEEAKTR